MIKLFRRDIAHSSSHVTSQKFRCYKLTSKSCERKRSQFLFDNQPFYCSDQHSFCKRCISKSMFWIKLIVSNYNSMRRKKQKLCNMCVMRQSISCWYVTSKGMTCKMKLSQSDFLSPSFNRIYKELIAVFECFVRKIMAWRSSHSWQINEINLEFFM